MKLKKSHLFFLLAAASSASSVHGANGTWTQLSSGGLWSATGNWSGGTVADGSGFTADFSTLNITADNTVRMDAPHTLSALKFGDVTTASHNWTLDNNAVGTNILTLAGTTPTITVNQQTATISAVIDGTVGMTKAGTSTLVLSGANTISGTIAVSAGTLAVGANNGLGTGSGAITISGAGTGVLQVNNGVTLGETGLITMSATGNTAATRSELRLGGALGTSATVSNNIQLDYLGLTGAGTAFAQITANGNSVANASIFGGTVTFAATKAHATGANNIFVLRGGSGSAAYGKASNTIDLLTGNASSAGTLRIVDGNINWEFSGSNNRWTTLDFNAATVSTQKVCVNAANTLSSEGVVTNTTTTAGGIGVLSLTNLANTTSFSQNIGGIQDGTFGKVSVASTQAATLTLSGSGTYTTSGIISGLVALTMNSSTGGTQTLTSVNTYTGVTTINNGTLNVATIGNGGVAGNLGQATNAATNLVLGGGTLQYSGLSASTNRNFTLTTGTGSSISVSTPASILTVSGASTATTGALTKTGAGTLVLSGANLHTGLTTVGAGTLQVTGSLKSDVTANLGGSLSGSGNTTGNVTLSTGSTIVGGTGTGTGSAATNVFKTTGTLSDNAGVLIYDYPTTPVTIGLHTIDVIQYTGPDPTAGNFSLANYHSGASVITGVSAGGANKKVTLGYTNEARTWNTLNGTWDTMNTLAWAEGDQKFATNDTVAFTDTVAGGTVTLNQVVTPGSVTFSNTANTYTVSGSGFISGATSLTKSGAGTVTLSTANNYTGGTTVNAGTLNLNGANLTTGGATLTGGTLTLGNASALGSGTLNITGGALNSSVTNLVNANNNAQTWNGDFSFTGTQNLNLGTGTVSLGTAAGTSRTVTVTANTLTIGGAISNGTTATGLTKAGAGTLTLGGTSTYNGTTSITAGTLLLTGTNALSSSSAINVGNASLQLNTLGYTLGALTVNSGITTATISFTQNSTTVSHTIGGATLSSPLTIAQSGNTGTNWNQISWSSKITGTGGGSGSDTLVFNNTGVLQNYFTTNTGITHDFSGNIHVKAGLIAVQSGNNGANLVVPDASMLIIDSTNSGTWRWNGGTGAFVETMDGLAGAGSMTTNAATATVTINASNASNNGNRNFSGAIGAGISITKSGAGTQTFSGSGSSYAGATTINGGILSITTLAAGGSNSSIGAAPVAGANLVINGGTLQLSGATAAQSTTRLFTIGTNGATLDASGTSNGAMNLTGTTAVLFSSSAAPASLTLTGTGATTAGGSLASILGDSGTGANITSLTKNGTGTWTLSGANTYSGGTTVKSGSLVLASGNDRLLTTGSVTLGDAGTTGKLALGNTVAPINQTLAGLTTTGLGGSVVGGNAAASLLTLNLAGTSTFDGTLGGLGSNENALALAKSGVGILTLTGTNTYAGTTTVGGGALLVNGSLAAGSTTSVETTAILGGTGAVNGSITIQSGGTIAPGTTGTGTLTTGATTISGTYACQVNGATADQLVVNGSLTLTGATLAVSQISAPTASSYVIATYTGSAPSFTTVTGLPVGYTLDMATTGQIKLVGNPLYNTWATSKGLTGANGGMTQDADGDGFKNLMEFAFGTDPSNAASGPVSWTGNVVNAHGQPTTSVTNIVNGVDFRAVFGRRKDYVEAGLTYTVQFSAGLDVWVNSVAVPSVLASDSEIDVVSVPYPLLIETANGMEKPTFFRVTVTGP